MSERVQASLRSSANALEAAGATGFCTGIYDLHGPQVEPEASYWLQCPAPRMITETELLQAVKADPYPTQNNILKSEIEELIQLARLRDEPNQIAHEPEICDITQEAQQKRMPLSLFLQLRPQPLGAVINTARGDNFPVIKTGRDLARYFEMETPGLQFRLALNYMIREVDWSPPRQARVWAALDTAIASALAAAWYFKWRGGKGVEFRPRPWECYEKLDVLFDRVTNSTNSADGARRGFPPGVQPMAAKPGEQVTPEALVIDIIDTEPKKSYPTPGSPRHPAYPSGHSTYSAAAARLLIEFFPNYKEELLRLADNTGIARLWGGVHWRSDHVFGQKVGTAVAELIIEQLKATGIPLIPAPRPADEAPPKPGQIVNPCAQVAPKG